MERSKSQINNDLMAETKIPVNFKKSKKIVNLDQMEIIPHQEKFDYDFPQEKTSEQLQWL